MTYAIELANKHESRHFRLSIKLVIKKQMPDIDTCLAKLDNGTVASSMVQLSIVLPAIKAPLSYPHV